VSANDPGTRKGYHYILGNEAADYHNDLSAGDGFGVPSAKTRKLVGIGGAGGEAP
jgi:hypothetical protein